ncbi:MAG: response regulator transcription factor [Salinisphaeraceae bacterium]
MSAHLLLVEDDPGLARFLTRGLRAEGFSVSHAASLQDAKVLLEHSDPEALILDRMLPDGDGLSLCRRLRDAGDSRPVLLLTARDDVADRIEGLRYGSDDYLCKPFDFDELVARVEVMLRRAGRVARHDGPEDWIRCGRVALNPSTMGVEVAGQPVKLTTREFNLLRLLAESSPRILSRERILSRVWGQTTDPLTNIVDVYIGRLRRKLDSDVSPSCIETLRGVGYRMP